MKAIIYTCLSILLIKQLLIFKERLAVNNFANEKIENVLVDKMEFVDNIKARIKSYSKKRKILELKYKSINEYEIVKPKFLDQKERNVLSKIYEENCQYSLQNIKYIEYIDSLHACYAEAKDSLDSDYPDYIDGYLTLLRQNKKDGSVIELVGIAKYNLQENTAFAYNNKDTIPLENLKCIDKHYKYFIQNPVSGDRRSYSERKIDQN